MESKPAAKRDSLELCAPCATGDAPPAPSPAQGGPTNVLFLDAGNAARSILAEAILNRIAGNSFKAYSAGSAPQGAVHPQALSLLAAEGFELSAFRSKSRNEFIGPGAPPLSFVITICDPCEANACPICPDQPISACWSMPNPAALEGPPAAIALAFADTYRGLTERIRRFTSLPMETPSFTTLQNIKAAINRAPRKRFMSELHLQVLKYSDELKDLSGKEFCVSLRLLPSLGTEFIKMRNISPRLKAAGLDGSKI